jgi:hypothetical protein
MALCFLSVSGMVLKLLREHPVPATITTRLAQTGFVLDLSPLVPLQIAVRPRVPRLVAGDDE